MSAAKAVDLSHLDRYTGGDRSVNEEVLRLFERSCHDILGQLETLIDDVSAPEAAKSWHIAAHTLKGAARSVGAFELADAAADAEKKPLNDRMAAIAALDRLKTTSQAVLIFIEDFLGRRG
jgi:HPt (histidine-containing phosphotransfer) domain-containing protein